MGNSPSIAFVLVMCKSESTTEVTKHLGELDLITETTIVDSPWRIVVKLESSNLDHIRDAIRMKIRKMDGIESTLTLVEYMS